MNQDVSVEVLNSREETLYVGVDNYLRVSSPSDSLLLTTSNGLIYASDTLYNIIPSRSGRAKVQVFSISNNSADTALLQTYNFLVYSLPQAKLRIGERIITNQRQLERDYLIKNNEFSVYLNDDIVTANEWMIVERITVGYRKGGYFIRINSNGNRLDEASLKEIENIRPGQEISIQVRVRCLGDIRKTIPVYKTRLY